MKRLVVVVLVLASPASAWADEHAEPVFRGLGPDGARTTGDAELTFVGLGEMVRVRTRALTVDRNGIGLYWSVGAALVDGAGDGASPDLGVLASHPIGEHVRVAGRAGLTVSGDGRDPMTAPYRRTQLAADPSNLAAGVPGVIYLRTAAAASYRDDGRFVRAEVGADLVVGEAEAAGTLVHADVAAGVGIGRVSVALEVQTLVADEVVQHVGITGGYRWYYAGVGAPFRLGDPHLDTVDVTIGARL